MSSEARPADPEAKPKRRPWRWLIAVLAIGFITFAWMLRPAPPLFRFTTGEGGQISFLKASLGSLNYSDHSKTYEKCYQLLMGYCPAALFNRIPSPKTIVMDWDKSRTGAEPLILLFDVASDPAMGKRLRLHDALKLEFVDSHGHRFPATPVSMFQIATGLEGQCFECFPRRDVQLTVQVTDRSSPQRTASFQVPNPGLRADFPKWTAEGLPQTKSDSEVDVTLGEVTRGSLLEGKSLPIEVVARDPAWASPSIASWIEDATGNHGNFLSPFESAWKARVLVARSDPSSFSAAEKWTIGPVALPVPGARVQIGQSGRIGAVRFKVTRLEFVSPRAPPSPIPLGSPGAAAGNFPSPAIVDGTNLSFAVEIGAFPANATLIAIVTDQAGQSLQDYKRLVPSIKPTATQWAGVRFSRKPDTTQVSLTLIVSRPKEFEFFIAPPSR
jgi:hypothetical protein